MAFCSSGWIGRFSLVVSCLVGFSFADSTSVTPVIPGASTDSLLASDPAEPQSPYEALEQIPPSVFQDRVVRANRALEARNDSTVSKDMRDFATAAYFYYTEEWDSAYAAYDSIRTREPSLEGSVILRMAQSMFNKKDYSQMRTALALGKKIKSESWNRSAALLRVQASLADSSLSAKAQGDSMKVFLDKYPKAEAPSLKYRYATYLENNKQQKQAKRLYMQLLTSSSSYKDSAFAAIRRLRSVKGAPESLSEKIAYAKMACAKDEASACLSLLDSIQILDSLAVAATAEPAEVPAEDSVAQKLPRSSFDMDTRIMLWERRGDALRNLKKDKEAIALYTFLVEKIESRPAWIMTLLKVLRNNSAQNAKAIKKMNALLQDVNQFSKENANNYWIRGFEHEQAQNYDSAVVYYKKLSHNRFKNNIKRQWAKFRIGFVYYKQEKWEEAIAAFTEATKEPFLWSGSGARMFLGDVYMKMGKDSLAREAYLDCIRDFPLAYYAHRSRLKLVEYKLMNEADVPYAHGVKMSPEETLAWIRNIQKGKPDSSYNEKRYERVRALFIYGFADQAFALYDEARKKNAKRLDFLYEYGKLFYEVGEVAAGYRLARQFQTHIDRRHLMTPPIDILHYLYPIPFKDQVVYHSGSRIDPFFVYSVMRQESIFNFEIASPVGACGLLQIMPSTGKMLAKQEGIENFDPKQLYNPYMNIRLGVRYLVDLKKEYSDDYMYVLGNYNAGPKPTKRWQAAGKGVHWDVRAEEVSYWETRDYVKRVLGNYWIYQEIYDKLN